jgi:hypothetical protein
MRYLILTLICIIGFCYLSLGQQKIRILGGYSEINAANASQFPIPLTHNFRTFYWTTKEMLPLFPTSVRANFYRKDNNLLVHSVNIQRVYVFEKSPKNYLPVCSGKDTAKVYNVQYETSFNLPVSLFTILCNDLSGNRAEII